MPLYEQKNPWSVEQIAWLLTQLARGATQAELWRQLTGQEEGRPVSIEAHEIGYPAFRKRLSALTGGNPRVIRPPKPRQLLQKDELSPIDVSDPKGMTEWLQGFINGNNKATSGDKLRALQMLQDIQAKLDAADPAKAIPSDRVLLANPKNVKLDAEYLTELVMTFREEFGGLHKLPLGVLNEHDLRLLAREAAQVLATKSGTDDLISLLDGIERKGESRTMKLKRLQWELQNLTDDEIHTIETKDLSKMEEGGDNEDD